MDTQTDQEVSIEQLQKQLDALQNQKKEGGDKVQAKVFLKRFGSAVLLGVAGIVLGGIAAELSFIPPTIGVGTAQIATNGAIGAVLFVEEWVRGILE